LAGVGSARSGNRTQRQQGGYTWRPLCAGRRSLPEQGWHQRDGELPGLAGGHSPFKVTSPLDQSLAEVSAGFDVWQGNSFSLRLSYDGRFGSHTSANGGALEWRAAF